MVGKSVILICKQKGPKWLTEAVKYCFNTRREISYLREAMQYVPFILYH